MSDANRFGQPLNDDDYAIKLEKARQLAKEARQERLKLRESEE